MLSILYSCPLFSQDICWRRQRRSKLWEENTSKHVNHRDVPRLVLVADLPRRGVQRVRGLASVGLESKVAASLCYHSGQAPLGTDRGWACDLTGDQIHLRGLGAEYLSHCLGILLGTCTQREGL